MIRVKKKSIAKNYLYNLFYQILVMIIPLITIPYLARVLGAEAIGIYSYTIAITTYFILFGSLGIAMYGQREIAYAEEDITKRSKTFYEILFLRFITLTISILIFFFTFCQTGEYQTYYKILLLEIFAASIDISWFFQGLEEFKKTVIRNTIVKLISVILIFILVKSPNDLTNYIIIYVASTLLGNLSLWFYIPKYTEKINLKSLNIKKHLKPTISLFIPQIAIQLYTVLDKVMIGAIITDKKEVGFYDQASKIIRILLTLATAYGTVMVPRMASTYAKKEINKLKEYMHKSFSFILMISIPLMFGIISISKHFVPMFFGPGYDKVIYLISIISPIILAISLSNVIGTQYLITTKQQKKFTISVTCGAIVNFVLNLILIHFYKSIGASIATVIAEFTVTIVQFYLIKEEFKVKEVFKLSYKYFIAAIIMFIISLIIGNLITNDILAIIIQIISSIIIYFSILLIIKDNYFKNILIKIKEKLK